jgi:alpha-tubulin suppressor-like RCC1 family protein
MRIPGAYLLLAAAHPLTVLLVPAPWGSTFADGMCHALANTEPPVIMRLPTSLHCPVRPSAPLFGRPSSLRGGALASAVCALALGCSQNRAAEIRGTWASADTTAAIDETGGVWAIGRIDARVDGTLITDSPVPVKVDGLRDAQEICFGQDHAVVRVVGNGMAVWDRDSLAEPYIIQTLPFATGLACGPYAMLAIAEDGTPWIMSAAGTSNAVDARITIDGLPPIVSGTCGESHCALLDEEGGLWTWGENDRGQLGSGTTTPLETPFLTPLASGVTALAVGGGHTLAIANGEVWGWGANDQGQLAQPVLEDVLAPRRLESLAGATHVAVGTRHSLVRFSNGTVAAFGANDRGQLGLGNLTDGPTTFPQYVVSVDDASSALAAGDHSVATSSRGVLSWGDNTHGQLGDGTLTESGTVQVIGSLTRDDER